MELTNGYRALAAGILAGLMLSACSTKTEIAARADSILATAERPNILWIVAEDVSPWMSMWGDNTVATPTFDAMADEGVTFMKAFSPNPICSPTRSALMTGRWPTSDGVHHHRRSRDGKGRDDVFIAEGRKTLPEIFRDNGYETFNIGKDDYNFVYDRRELYSEGPDGVEGHIGELEGPDFDWTALAESDTPFFGQIQIRGGKVRVEEDVPMDKASIDMMPYYPDIPSMREGVEAHYKAISYTDNEVQGILDELESTGEADNTVVFFISDHGMLMLRHKQFLYDGGVHVPVFITWPEGEDKLMRYGAKREQLISLIDLSAAALELADIPVPDYFEARGLFGDDMEERHYVPLSRDRADYTFDQIRAIRTQDFKYIRHKFPNTPYLLPSYRDEWPMAKDFRRLYAQGKLTPEQETFMMDKRPPEELFDLRADPHEVRNLASDPAYQETLAEMSAILDDWIKTTGDMGQFEETEPEIGAVVARWQELCTDPRCIAYVAKNGMEEASAANGVVIEGR